MMRRVCSWSTLLLLIGLFGCTTTGARDCEVLRAQCGPMEVCLLDAEGQPFCALRDVGVGPDASLILDMGTPNCLATGATCEMGERCVEVSSGDHECVEIPDADLRRPRLDADVADSTLIPFDEGFAVDVGGIDDAGLDSSVNPCENLPEGSTLEVGTFGPCTGFTDLCDLSGRRDRIDLVCLGTTSVEKLVSEACIRTEPEPVAEFNSIRQCVGPAGGVLEFAGFSLTIPVDALTERTVVKMSQRPRRMLTGFTPFSSLVSVGTNEPTRVRQPLELNMPIVEQSSEPIFFFALSGNDENRWQPIRGRRIRNRYRVMIPQFGQGFVGSVRCQDSQLRDECGICDEDPENDNTRCTQDCLGIWDGGATRDDCGVCDGDPENDNLTCVRDCAGVWGGGSERDCEGVCAGQAKIDDCGVCDADASNDNSTCTEDCAGVWGGTSILDDCGVCDADTSNDNSTCTEDCAGVWGGASILDDCGVCDADTSNDNESCVARCIASVECLSGLCIDEVCAKPHCADEVLNNSESDVDCGGGCSQCDNGLRCRVANDCRSGVCDNQLCAAGSENWSFRFGSGFDGNTVLNQSDAPNCADDLDGEDAGYAAPNHWTNDLESYIGGAARICYMGGHPDERRTILQLTPGDENALSTQNTLKFEVVAPNEVVSKITNGVRTALDDDVPCNGALLPNSPHPGDEHGARKARIQHALTNLTVSSFEYEVSLRLGAGFQHLSDNYPLKINWMTIGEFWNEQPNGDRGRLTLNLVKETAVSGESTPFYLGIKSEYQASGSTDGWLHHWRYPGEDVAFGSAAPEFSLVAVPVEEWIRIRVRSFAGDDQTGLTVVELLDASGQVQSVANVPGATLYPDGEVIHFTTLHTMKLYTNGNLMCWLKGEGFPLEIWWDNYELNLP